jgi:hypothetical protein
MPREGGAKVPHPPAVRAEALELAARIGPSQAADQLDLSVDTVKSWMKRENEKALRELQRRGFDLPATRGTPWTVRRGELLLQLADLAQESAAACREAVREGRSKAAQEFSSVLVRAVDRAELLGGLPTSRSESRSLALHLQSEEGLAAVKREARAIVASREAAELSGPAAGNEPEDAPWAAGGDGA